MIWLAIICSFLSYSVESIDRHPEVYHVLRTESPILIDGQALEDVWSKASYSNLFVDIEGKGDLPALDTKIKMLWDQDYLYVYAEMEEPHVWASLTQRDAVIYQDDDFEVFIDPDGDTHNYTEIEVNAFNTIWDLMLMRPYRTDREEKVLWNWDIPQLESAVHIDGTINDPSDVDKGWSLEIAIPMKTVIEFDGKKEGIEIGDVWRINFSRVDWDMKVVNEEYTKVKNAAEHNWVWSPQGAINMHMPECWGYLVFEGSSYISISGRAYIDPEYYFKKDLVDLFLAQKKYYKKHKSYADSIDMLEFKGEYIEKGRIEISTNEHQLFMIAESSIGNLYGIDHTGKLRKLNE